MPHAAERARSDRDDPEQLPDCPAGVFDVGRQQEGRMTEGAENWRLILQAAGALTAAAPVRASSSAADRMLDCALETRPQATCRARAGERNVSPRRSGMA